VLDDDEPSPLLPREGDEPLAADSADEDEAQEEAAPRTETQPDTSPDVQVQIDFEGLAERIVSLNVPERSYSSLTAGPEGMIFYLESSPGGGFGSGATLQRYDLEEREARKFMDGVQSFTLSADAKKLLYRAGGNWGVVDSDKAPPLDNDAGRVDVANVRMRVDPKAEFRQMFNEGWRFQRDYLYVENMHGVDYEATKAMYAPLVEHVAHRSDLTYLLDWMGGEVAIGHSFVRGGDLPDVDDVPVGLLGADLEVANGRYRIVRIYTGESWNPELRGPLAAPGVDVNEGDYLLAVNGQELVAPENPYRLFEGTANRQTAIRVGPNPSMDGSRLVTVVPVSSESALRREAWVADNRRKVDELSGGKLAYVWLPNTGQGGYDSFNRWYFAQQDRDGAIIDERFNGGGSAADYIVDVLGRDFDGYFNNVAGDRYPFTSPSA
ncbi:MAG: PDZ domain-containing protein, partial [Longimicrobiales bacterium]